MKERKSIWDRVDALHKISRPDDYGFTVGEYAARYSTTIDAAMNKLKRLAQTGVLLAGWKMGASGHKIRVFRFPD